MWQYTALGRKQLQLFPFCACQRQKQGGRAGPEMEMELGIGRTGVSNLGPYLCFPLIKCHLEVNQHKPRVPIQGGRPWLHTILHMESGIGPGHMSHMAQASAIRLANRAAKPLRLCLDNTTQQGIKAQRWCLGSICGVSPWHWWYEMKNNFQRGNIS